MRKSRFERQVFDLEMNRFIEIILMVVVVVESTVKLAGGDLIGAVSTAPLA